MVNNLRLDSASLLEAALIYAEKFDFSIIPVKPNKKAYIKWEPYQKRRATSDEIKSWWTHWPTAMIGIVTGSISGVVAIDIDTQEGQDAITQYVPDSLLTPTSKTPKGGQHLYFRAPEKPISNNARTIPGCDFRGEGGYVIAPPSINGTGQAYKWLLSIEESEPADLPSTYISFINSYAFKVCEEEKVSHTESQVVTGSHKILTEGRRDNDLFHLANCLIKSHTPPEKVRQYLEILAKSCNPPFPVSEVEEKIKSALKRVEQRKRNLTEEIREWVLVTSGHFLVTDVHRESQLVTKEERHAANVALRRLAEEGVIERYGDKRGAYRRIEREYIKVDLQSASGKPLDMRWPFEIEKFYRPFSKNLISVMGTPDSGKSAFLFNVARMNMDKFKVHYFSSEMGADELWDRLANFGIPKEEWMKKCEMIERSSNFSDVMFPDDLNIIDYLDMTGGEGKEFYKVGEFLEHIYGKLRDGIAVIGIQKNYGQDLGRGGLGTIERPRLALAMEASKIKIVKCKNWFDKKFNPNHLELEYKLVDGCIFTKIGDWSKPAKTPNLYHETPNQYKVARKRLGKENICKEFSRQSGE